MPTSEEIIASAGISPSSGMSAVDSAFSNQVGRRAFDDGSSAGSTLFQESAMSGAGNGKYDTSFIVYPSNLQEMTSNTSYVMFHVIVDNETKLLGEDQRGEVTNGGLPASLNQIKQVGADLSSAISNGVENMGTSGTAGALGATAMKMGGMSLEGLGMLGGMGLDAVSSGAVSAGDALTDTPGKTVEVAKSFADGAKSTFSRTKSRLKHSIVLPMPADFSTSYSMGWNENDSNLLVDTLSDPNGVANLAKTVKDPASVGKGVSGAVATVVQTAMPAAQKITGIISNPRKTQLFEGVALREFTFNYIFAPKSNDEYMTIQRIIAAFKYYMHPSWEIATMNDNSPFMRVPSEFQIEFKHAETSNVHVNKITDCVLKTCTINYTPNGSWSKHLSGAPTQLAVSLVFGELSQLTKESILLGY